jgi:hypothetical protein
MSRLLRISGLVRMLVMMLTSVCDTVISGLSDDAEESSSMLVMLRALCLL